MTPRIMGARCSPLGDPETIIRTAAEWARARGSEVLLADARVVLGPGHVESAIHHAERARVAGTMVARTVALETLRYLSGRRQVAEAIRIAGVRRGSKALAVLVFGEARPLDLIAAMGWRSDASVLEAEGKDLAELGITRRERDTVGRDRAAELALEHVALVDVER